MTKKSDKSRFEPSLARLEEIVQKLEDGSLPLEESLALFEEGVGLSRHCLEVLNQAERKVEELVAAKDTVPFHLPDEEA